MRSTVSLAVAFAAATCITTVAAAQKLTGNGAPSGAHYNLNIIGVPHYKTQNMDGGGNVIFVALNNKDGISTKILLSPGEFGVLDKNGTDDGKAAFSLPAPGTYTIYARALGKPGGSSTMTTCATDPTTGEVICSTAQLISIREAGRSKFDDVTRKLTTIENTSLALICGGRTTVSLFDECLQGYFWDYDNNGLKLLQIRFYYGS